MSLGDDHGFGGDASSRVDDGFRGTGQTRTRLPGTDTDVYGGARRPVRNSRSLITVVGVVVLLIAAIAFANQGGGGDEDRAGETPKGPESAPTAATGVKPVQGKVGGIPTGYGRNEQGAQSAAANYAVALGSDGMFKTGQPTGHRQTTVYSPAAAGKLPGRLRTQTYSPPVPRQDRPRRPTAPRPTGSPSSPAPYPSGTKVENYATDSGRRRRLVHGSVRADGPRIHPTR